MKVLFYGRLSEAIAPEIELASSSNCSIAELRQRLAAAHPHAAATLRSQRSRVLINSSLVGVVSGFTCP